MTARRDPDRLIRTYLDDGPTELADRSYDAVRAQIDHIRQRAVFGPWREPQVSKYVTFAIAAAAVLVVAVVAIGLFSGQGGGIGAPRPTATVDPIAPPISTPAAITPAPSPIPSPTLGIRASPSPMQITVGELAPGTYVARLPFPIPLRFTVPSGWEGQIPGPNAMWLNRTNGQAQVAFELNVALYADPCHFEEGLLEPSPGPTVDDFAQALVALPGLEATTPTTQNIGGYRGLQLTLTAPDSFAGCSMAPEGYLIWRLPLGATTAMVPGEMKHLWILDIDGERLLIEASERPGQTAQERAEVQAILDSLEIER